MSVVRPSSAASPYLVERLDVFFLQTNAVGALHLPHVVLSDRGASLLPNFKLLDPHATASFLPTERLQALEIMLLTV